MTCKRYWLGLLAAVAMVFAACSDDSNSNPKKDGGGADQTARKDIAPPTADVGRDKGTPALTCEKKCTDEAPYLCVTDSSAGKCVECLEDGHCIGNPGALGPKCATQRGICICETNADCSNNKSGKVCDKKDLCSCATDADCTGTDKCVGTLFGVSVCTAPCASDADCTSSLTPKCDTNTGKCLACLSDKDCTEDGAPYCNAGSCAQCSKPEHCAGNLSGNACVDGSCSCAADTDCGTTSWGPTCVTKKGILGEYKQCGCNVDTDCGTTNQNGPTCYTKFKKCSCGADADCTVTGLDKCNFPYGGATYQHCQKACASNADCADIRDLNTCDTTTGKCVACVADTDCSGATPFCSQALGSCVACKADTDCATPAAPFCGPVGTCVECKADTDCTGSFNGGKCTTDGSCGCVADTDCTGTNAWGTKCISVGSAKRCGCSADQECSGNANGPTCDKSYDACTCGSDTDCKVGGQTKCGMAFAGVPFKSCQKPCTADTDCVAKEGLALCDASTSLCIACKASTDCTYNAFQTTCDTSNSCVECLADADCNPNGLGPKCDTANSFCVCASDAECATNPNGKKCDAQLQACSCTGDADCPTGKTCTGSFASIPICQ